MIANMISMMSDHGIRVEIVPLQPTIKFSGSSEVLHYVCPAIPMWNPSYQSFFTTLNARSAALPEIRSVNFGHPLFTNVTHLKIFDTGIAEEVLADIPLLHALTHLCLDNSIAWDIVLRVLPECPRLELLLVLLMFARVYRLERISGALDLRYVIRLNEDYWGNCEAGGWRLPDLWIQDYNLVAGKCKGEIKGRGGS
ncbi:hypothetical protein B0H14DRAFT_2652471 [Mycena olivaceomarginata]|nr:hypothetical protein B0H14DRAFT_2652471 [Mycena olivaceomarginata]